MVHEMKRAAQLQPPYLNGPAKISFEGIVKSSRPSSSATMTALSKIFEPVLTCACLIRIGRTIVGAAGSWRGIDDQVTRPCFNACPRPRYPLDRAPFEIERAEEEPAFTKLVYLEGSLLA
jgi:hypothetical protein